MNERSAPGESGTGKGSRLLSPVWLLVVLTFTLAVYLAGAMKATPGSGVALFDLEVIRSWARAGHIAQWKTPPMHLAKPGYLLYLFALMPGGGATLPELRRVLIVNALLLASGIVLVALALWRRELRAAAIVFSLAAFLVLPIRDSADYVASDPLAIGFCLVLSAALVAWPASPASAVGLGAACALFALVRPNTAVTALLIAGLVYTCGQLWRSVWLLALGLAVGLAVLAAAATISSRPLNPLALKPSLTLLFATADYFWPADIGKWPEGGSPEETAQLQSRKTRERWRNFLGQNGPDRNRSLVWRFTHAVLSAEQFPSLWNEPAYAAASKGLRRWWWLGTLFGAAASFACAIGGLGAWRFVPLATLLVAVGQGVVFGAETRFVLPLIPIGLLGFILTVPSVRLSPFVVLGSLIAPIAFLLAVLKAPDTVASDYAVVGSGGVVRQQIGRAAFQSGSTVTVHARLLVFPDAAPAAYDVIANDQVVYRRALSSTQPHPAYVSFSLDGGALEQARRDGLSIEVRFAGDPSTGSTLGYPVVPPLFGPSSTINAQEQLPSAYGGLTTGGFPVWAHPGADPPAPPSADR